MNYKVEKNIKQFKHTINNKEYNVKHNYELYIPNWVDHEKLIPVVILIHGFQSSLKYHKYTAMKLAEKSIAVLIYDMSSLMGLTKNSRHLKRELNILSVISFCDWIQQEKATIGFDSTRIAIAGHSAGGAVGSEAVYKLLIRHNESPNFVKPRCLLLLDAVPWKHTLDNGKNEKLNLLVRDPKIRNSIKPSPCVVCSLRAEKSSLNANNLVLTQLIHCLGRSSALSSPITDILINTSAHGDFMYGPIFPSFIDGTLRACGIMSAKDNRETIEHLLEAFLVSELFESGAGAGVADHENEDGLDSYDKIIKQFSAAKLITVTELTKKDVDENPKIPLYLN